MTARRPGRLRESLAFLNLFLPFTRKRSIYALLGSHNLLAEAGRFVNMGLWTGESTYDGAGRALARRLLADIPPGPADAVLDVGGGFGEAARLWAGDFRPRSLVSLGHDPGHTAAAGRSFREAGAGPGPRALRGDAVRLPFRPGRFQRVAALESAFHFRTRADFFREAHRVLAPGGWLALADLVPREAPSAWSPLRRLLFRGGRALWQFPPENLYPVEEYLDRLRQAGFVDVRAVDISAEVFPGFKAYSRKRLEEKEIRERVNPVLRRLWRARAQGGGEPLLAYLIVHARKPEGAAPGR